MQPPTRNMRVGTRNCPTEPPAAEAPARTVLAKLQPHRLPKRHYVAIRRPIAKRRAKRRWRGDGPSGRGLASSRHAAQRRRTEYHENASSSCVISSPPCSSVAPGPRQHSGIACEPSSGCSQLILRKRYSNSSSSSGLHVNEPAKMASTCARDELAALAAEGVPVWQPHQHCVPHSTGATRCDNGYNRQLPTTCGSNSSSCSAHWTAEEAVDAELLAELLALEHDGCKVVWPRGWDSRRAALRVKSE